MLACSAEKAAPDSTATSMGNRFVRLHLANRPRPRRASGSITPALAPGVGLDNAPRPAADSLIVVTPMGGDTTRAAVACDLDASRAIGFDGLFPGKGVRCLFANPGLAEEWREPARAAFATGDLAVHLVRDSAGLIAQRVLAHLVNVASSIAEQRIASPPDIDGAVKLGLGYPHGPLAWGDVIGATRIYQILHRLVALTGDPRYRPTNWLTRRAALGLSLTQDD
jgi:3-hydroxybutyryl-CoA dehydrogenase